MVFVVGKRNSSISPLAAVTFQKSEGQWRAYGGAALWETEAMISPRSNLRPTNKIKDFHWSRFPAYVCMA